MSPVASDWSQKTALNPHHHRQMMQSRGNGQLGDAVRVNHPGLLAEKLPSGHTRWRVRVLGKPGKKIRLHVAPDHPLFGEHYHAARSGIELPAPEVTASCIKGSVGWLVQSYQAAMRDMETNGALDASTVHQRTVFLDWLRSEVGEYSAAMPTSQLVLLRDKRAATPGAANNLIKTVRAMYAWGIQRGMAKANPAMGIPALAAGNGARPWSIDDLSTFRQRHPFGTMPHLALTLLMFTAARIGDVARLGRANEVKRGDVIWLDWQPEKKGSKRVQIPILPPLLKAIRAQQVIGPTYLMTQYGKSFATKKALGTRFGHWVEQAGLGGLSAHGIRKAAGELLALQGASQYHIMAIHGHANAKTSEIYTEGADRARLAEQAMQKLAGMDW